MAGGVVVASSEVNVFSFISSFISVLVGIGDDAHQPIKFVAPSISPIYTTLAAS